MKTIGITLIFVIMVGCCYCGWTITKRSMMDVITNIHNDKATCEKCKSSFAWKKPHDSYVSINGTIKRFNYLCEDCWKSLSAEEQSLYNLKYGSEIKKSARDKDRDKEIKKNDPWWIRLLPNRDSIL